MALREAACEHRSHHGAPCGRVDDQHSVLFMLPAVLREGGTSIVVVLFLALMDDLVERARTIGVDSIRFRASLSSGWDGLSQAARLIVVNADIVSTPEFSAYADGLLCVGLLRQIFVDECRICCDIADHGRSTQS